MAPKGEFNENILLNHIMFVGIMFAFDQNKRRHVWRNMRKVTASLPQPHNMRQAAGQAVGVLKLLANEDRLLLLCQLSHAEMCVSELEQQLDIRQPTLSQQLGVLRGEGVVATRREGKNIYYSIADHSLLEILKVLDRLYCPK